MMTVMCMKTRLMLWFTAGTILLVGLASCRDRLEETSVGGTATGSDVLMANLEEPVDIAGTKLKLKENTTTGKYDMVWADGDQISVIGTGNAAFTLSKGADTPQGQFTGSVADAGEGPYYAVFPYSETASVSDGKIRFSIPQTKGAQQGNVASKTIPCVAKLGSNDGLVSAGMHNVTGLLRLSFTSSTSVSIKKITLHDLGGNMLWGDCTVPIKANGEPDYDNIELENGTNSISMLWNSTATITTSAKSFCFPVPAGSLDRGFSVVLYKYDPEAEDGVGEAYSFIQKISSPVVAMRSVIIEMDNAVLSNKSESSDVKRRGYYKSLFVDAGMFLSNYYTTSHIPAIKYIGLDNDYEYFASHSSSSLTGSTRTNDSIIQRNLMVTSDGTNSTIGWKDANGILVYPDGAPRFRLIYANGGRSYDHGRSLAKDGRDRVHYFFMNGGSYTGSCAGSFLAATWVDGTKRYGHSKPENDWSFGLFPGELTHTHLPKSPISNYPSINTGMKVLPRLKELGYFNFSSIDTLEDIRHHGGSYYPHNSRNRNYEVEELLSFQYSITSKAPMSERYNPANTEDYMKYSGKFIQIVDSVNTWAYKKNATTGRMVVTGSHPEKAAVGNARDFIAMMYLYAMDGIGDPHIKEPDLKMDSERAMAMTTADGDPEYTRIGDRQYHHFKFTTSQPIENFQLTLSSEYGAESGIDLYLSLRKDDLAWLSDADYVICTKGGNKSFNIKELPAGTWYVGVYCATTVTSAKAGSNPYYWKYSGKTEVLDGIPYSVGISIATPGIDTPKPYPGSDIGTDSLDD